MEDTRKKLRIAYIDFWPEWSTENFITPVLQKYFDVIENKYNPEVVFFSIFGRDHLKYNCKKILYVAENVRYNYIPEKQETIQIALDCADYTITYDPENNTNFRLPLWQAFLMNNPHQIFMLQNRINNFENFDRFCSFVISNKFNPFRNAFFLNMKDNFKVFSYGREFNNDISLIQFSKDRYWRDAKIEFFQNLKHKYAITFENSMYPYYTTEKLMDAFLDGSLPLYWGDPKVNQDWNSKAFINVQKLGEKETMELIREMENNDDLFLEKYLEPVFTSEQDQRHAKTRQNFEHWLINKIN